MAKVYVTQERDFDFSPAEQFGELVFMTANDFWNIKKSRHNDDLVNELDRHLKEYKPADGDYLLLAGSTMVIATVFMLLGRYGYKNVSILRWSNRDRVYEPAEINISGVA